MPIRFVRQDELSADGFTNELVGRDFGGVGACVMSVDAGQAHGFVSSSPCVCVPILGRHLTEAALDFRPSVP